MEDGVASLNDGWKRRKRREETRGRVLSLSDFKLTSGNWLHVG